MTTGEMWRAVSSATYSEMWQSVRDAADEILQYRRDAVDVPDVTDDITEQADGLIPAYYSEQVQEWVAIGMPEPDDYGMSNGLVFGHITGALFEWYHGELSQVVEDLLGERFGEVS